MGVDISMDIRVSSSKIERDKIYKNRREKLVLVLLSDLYSELVEISVVLEL